MPISIYPTSSEVSGNLAEICKESWSLPEQTEALKNWLDENSASYPHGEYVADIGFMVRAEASGGGASIDPKTMRKMADLGMSLFLSEYR